MVYKDLKNPRLPELTEQSNNNSVRYAHGELLVVDSGPIHLTQQRFVLSEIISIGRNEHNDIVVDDVFVSYEHATINRNKQGYWLTDLNSTNKTYLNNQPVVESLLLHKGDLIKIGAVTFSFEG